MSEPFSSWPDDLYDAGHVQLKKALEAERAAHAECGKAVDGLVRYQSVQRDRITALEAALAAERAAHAEDQQNVLAAQDTIRELELQCAELRDRGVRLARTQNENGDKLRARITELEAALAAERQRSSAYVEGTAQSIPVENG